MRFKPDFKETKIPNENPADSKKKLTIITEMESNNSSLKIIANQIVKHNNLLEKQKTFHRQGRQK